MNTYHFFVQKLPSNCTTTFHVIGYQVDLVSYMLFCSLVLEYVGTIGSRED